MNTYQRWMEYTDIYKQYFLYLSYKQFFGKHIKYRVRKKWHSRFIKERNKKCKCLYTKIFFGRSVYTYHNVEKNLYGFTSCPKQYDCHSYPLNYAIDSKNKKYLL